MGKPSEYCLGNVVYNVAAQDTVEIAKEFRAAMIFYANNNALYTVLRLCTDRISDDLLVIERMLEEGSFCGKRTICLNLCLRA